MPIRAERMLRRWVVAAGLLGGAGLAGCSLAPTYELPVSAPVAEFKEAGNWTHATPQDDLGRGAWWRIYGDATLDGLEERIDPQNPSLAVSIARFDQSRAYLAEISAGLLPSLDIGGHVTRNRQSDDRPLRGSNQPNEYDDRLVGAVINYEFDLWGRVRNAVAVGRYQSQALAADLESLRLSLQAHLASYYFELRGLDAQSKLLTDTIDVYRRALDLTNARHDQGIASGLDVEQAKTQLENAQAEFADVAASRALLEHAIAVLAGENPTTFSLTPLVASLKVPNVPAGLPSTLLQRRPDIAAAERTVSAANARIGVARAAFFPSISLGALAGFQNTSVPPLFGAANTIWSIGPQAALNVLDAGRRRAEIALTKAAYREAVATYRIRVLQAFGDVEDNLALLNHLADEARSKSAAVQSSDRVQTLAMAMYGQGAASYLDVSTAQTTALQAKLAAESVQSRRLVASVRLIQAIGGGWQAEK
jgi:NodT family efflux transporter outer membrane factor (OMF) lipoprotein